MKVLDLFQDAEHFCAMPIAQRLNGRALIIGSATCILPGLFLTAKHNVQHWNKEAGIPNENESADQGEANYNVELLHVTKDLTMLVWHAKTMHMSLDSDIAVVIAQKCAGYHENDFVKISPRPGTVINLHVPSVGDTVMTLGYPKTTNIPLGGVKTKHQIGMISGGGLIEDISWRGFSMAKGLSIQSSAPVIGGMSGGPAFNAAGELIGINTSSFEPAKEEDRYTSFVTLIPGMMNSEILIKTEASGLTTTTIYDMARDGYVNAKGLSHWSRNPDKTLAYDDSFVCDDC